MTVKELIDKLQEFPMDMEVWSNESAGDSSAPITIVDKYSLYYPKGKTVVLIDTNQ